MDSETPIPRDKRVDQIGFVKEADEKHAKLLKGDVKLSMINKDQQRVAGDFFEGQLVTFVPATVNPAKFLKLFEQEKITRAQFLAAVSVNTGPCEKFLSGDQLAKISDLGERVTQLRVGRIKGVECKLVDAIAGLADEVLASRKEANAA
jgi:hypothetical protein